jgi:excisionase family DNA binding protein
MDLMTVADACVELRVHRRTLNRMIARGLLPAPKRLGNFKQFYFNRAEFTKACKKGLR